jgi:5-methylcytosine-specific restriction endonuclease McrA
MEAVTRLQVRQRAGSRCEYCHIPEAATPFIAFHTEHIIAQQHLVDDSLDNLALACDRCNAYKGPNLSSIAPDSNTIVNLFHPRRDNWDEHFELMSGLVIGKTPTGRATVRLLKMNAPRRVQLRREFLELEG